MGQSGAGVERHLPRTGENYLSKGDYRADAASGMEEEIKMVQVTLKEPFDQVRKLS